MTEDELTEEELEELEESLGHEGYGSPEPEKKDSIFKFFREILRTKESKKVGNLNETEINNIRIYLRLADYANIENMPKVEKYMRAKAEVIASTSMSRKGFLAQLFVTQIKKEQKLKQPTEQKKGFFFSKPQQSEE